MQALFFLLARLRRAAAALLLPLALFLPGAAHADALSLLDTLANAVGVWPSELPSVMTIKAVPGALQSCSHLSDSELMNCAQAIIDNADIDPGDAEKVETAINIYLDLEKADYVALMKDSGPLIGCLAAQVMTGFDVCGALNAILAVGEAVADVVGAFVDGLAAAAEWISCLFGCSSDSGPPISETMFTSLRDNFGNEGLTAHMDPGGGAAWTAHLAKVTGAAKQIAAQINIQTKVEFVKPADITAALTAYIAYSGERWDAEMDATAWDRSRKDWQAWTQKQGRAAMVSLYNADTVTRAALAKTLQAQCIQADTFGNVVRAWRLERGKIKPKSTLNNLPTPEEFCLTWVATAKAEKASTKRADAIKAQCSVQAASGDFDSLQCKTYAGLGVCKAARDALGVSLANFFGSAAKGGGVPNCAAVSTAAGAEFSAVLAQFDPKHRCTLQIDGKTVNCTRDLSVSKACQVAVKRYPTQPSPSGDTMPANRPVIGDIACVLQRDAAYQSLVSQVQATAGQLAQALENSARGHVERYNADQTNPSRRLRLVSDDYKAAFMVNAADPLLIDVVYTDPAESLVAGLVKKASPPLAPHDASDPDNDGQDQPGFNVVHEMTSRQRALMDQLVAAIEAASKSRPALSGGGLAAGAAVTERVTGSPVINPALVQGAGVQRTQTNPGAGCGSWRAIATPRIGHVSQHERRHTGRRRQGRDGRGQCGHGRHRTGDHRRRCSDCHDHRAFAGHERPEAAGRSWLQDGDRRAWGVVVQFAARARPVQEAARRQEGGGVQAVI
jgi:hypothetical protein